jgi:hypothetical protein
MSELDSVKVGDLVIYDNSSGWAYRQMKEIHSVSRITDKTIVLAFKNGSGGLCEKKFWKKNGFGIGLKGFIIIPKDGEVEEICRHHKSLRLICAAKQALESTDYKKLIDSDIELLEKVVEQLKQKGIIQ